MIELQRFFAVFVRNFLNDLILSLPEGKIYNARHKAPPQNHFSPQKAPRRYTEQYINCGASWTLILRRLFLQKSHLLVESGLIRLLGVPTPYIQR